jgi:putative oxidoreductase
MYQVFDLIGRILISAIFIYEAIDSLLFAEKTKMTMAEYGIHWKPDLLLTIAVIFLLIGLAITFVLAAGDFYSLFLLE